MWQYAWRETWRRKGRSLANIIGYLLAVAMMVVLISVLVFSRDASSAVLTSTGTHFIGFTPKCNTEYCSAGLVDEQNEGFLANGGPAKLMSASVVAEIQELSSVADASPFLLFKFNNPQDGSTFTVGGFDPSNTISVATTCCSVTDVVQGRFLLPDDYGLVLLEQSYAVSNFLQAGSRITIAGEEFTVAGIVSPGIRPAKADIYMTLADAERVINKRLLIPLDNQINIVLVESANANVHQQAMKDVSEILGERSLISTYGCYRPAATAMGINENGVWLVIGILGISVVALALKSQYSSVIERRRDIGILKAIGWSDRDIVSQILDESLIQAAIGAAGGCLIAVIILLAVPLEALSNIETTATITISPVALAAGFGLALLGGMVAGIFPALTAARLRPADSLRYI